MKARDSYFMMRALELAQKAEGSTSPNPVVGCVVVKDNKVIGEGFHKKAGLPHAEIEALKKCGKYAACATMYVTLEPCDHYGKTPPCTDAIINAGIKKVIIAMKDPNPLNNGKGIRKLRSKGISVVTGVLSGPAKSINKPFIKHTTTRLPLVTLKIAESLDGKIADSSGGSKWVSNRGSRSYVQKLRSLSDAVMVGVNTVIKDDPMLIARGYGKKTPTRVVVDSRLRISLDSRIVKSADRVPLIVFTTDMSSEKKREMLKKEHVTVVRVGSCRKRTDLRQVLMELGKRGVLSLLVEGGSELAGSLLDSKLADRAVFFIAPKIIGARDAVNAVKGTGVRKLKDAALLKNVDMIRIDDDIMISGDIS